VGFRRFLDEIGRQAGLGPQVRVIGYHRCALAPPVARRWLRTRKPARASRSRQDLGAGSCVTAYGLVGGALRDAV
jgi:hypothetical protein